MLGRFEERPGLLDWIAEPPVHIGPVPTDLLGVAIGRCAQPNGSPWMACCELQSGEQLEPEWKPSKIPELKPGGEGLSRRPDRARA